MNLKYIVGGMISAPLLPLMYMQGKTIRRKIPKLPEATGTHGIAGEKTFSAPKLQLLTLGESTIAGVGVKTHEEGFSGTLAQELSGILKRPIEWNVCARSGYTARKVKYKLIPKIEQEHFDLIVISIGGNDAFELQKPSRWKEDAKALIIALKEKFPEAVIVFCNMPPIKEFPAFTSLIRFTIGNLVEILGDELQKVVADFENTHYFGDRLNFQHWFEKYNFSRERGQFFSDGLHPSKLTYQTWAKEIAFEISKVDNIMRALKLAENKV